MAAIDSPTSLSNPSFALRDPVQIPNFTFLRSISTKEPNSSTPPQIPNSISLSLPSSPLHHHHKHSAAVNHHHPSSSYLCLSSVLKKDGQILSIALSNGVVYTGSESNVVRIWRLPEFQECGGLKTKACVVVAIEVTSDRVYAAYADCKIRVWQRRWDGGFKHVRLATIPRIGGYVRSYFSGKVKALKHMGAISSLAINMSDDILYSASLDKTVKVWRISDLKCIETIQAHSAPINAILVADDGVLYTASDDATVRVWQRSFGRGDQAHSLTVTLPAKYSPVRALTLNTGVLYGGCTDGYIHYWQKGWFSSQYQYGGALQGHNHAVMCIASVAKYVISGSADATSKVWVREQDGQHTCLAVLQGHRGPIRCVTAFLGHTGEESEDGCTVCTGSLDGVLKVWRVTCTGNSARRSAENGGGC